MRNKKTVHLPDKLHQELKLASTKEGIALEAFVAKKLWGVVGVAIAEVKR